MFSSIDHSLRCTALALGLLVAFSATGAEAAAQSKTQQNTQPLQAGKWIWFPEKAQDKTTRYFRSNLNIGAEIERATFHFAADDFALLYLNGKPARQVGFGLSTNSYDLTNQLRSGLNTFALQVNNSVGEAGLLAYGEVRLKNGKTLYFTSDKNWRTTKSPQPDNLQWAQPEFDDSAWQQAREISAADGGPWRSLITPAAFRQQQAFTRSPIDAEHKGLVMIDDFSDVSSWMGGALRGQLPASSNPFHFSFGSAASTERDDGYSGEFVFNFTEPGGRARFEKNAALLLKSAPYAIEFDANNLGHAGSIEFEFVDADNARRFRTAPLRIDGDGWQHYRLEIDEKSIADAAQMQYPIALRNVYINIDQPAQGSILIDDIAYETDIRRHGGAFSARPDYHGIANLPGDPVRVQYRVRNRTGQVREASWVLDVFNAANRKIMTKAARTRSNPHALETISFDLPADLPVGPYRTELRLEGSQELAHFGWVGVFTPNGRRINTIPMWFGVEDQEIRNAPAETELHVQWMRALGVDITRNGIIGSMLESIPGTQVGFEGYTQLLTPFFDAGIDVLVEYAGGVPQWTHPLRDDGRHAPIWDQALLAQHMEQVGRFIAQHPQIKYFEFLNEPELSHFSSLSLDQYLASLQTVYTALKAGAPEVKVTTGGSTAGNHPSEKPGFSQGMYQQGKAFYDIAAFHHHGTADDYLRTQKRLQGWLNQAGKEAPIGNTEAGFRSYQGEHALFIRQAEMLLKKIAVARSEHSEFYIWFMLQDYWDKYIPADDSFGLVTVDNQPKPSFIAYNELIRQLANTLPATQPVSLDQRLVTLGFSTAEEDVLVNWPAIEGNAFNLVVKTDKPVTLVDLWGNAKVITPSHGMAYINTSPLPFYLRAPAGSIRPAEPLVSISGNGIMAAGSNNTLRLAIRNPYSGGIRGTLQLGEAKRSFSLAAAAGTHIELPLSIPAQTAIGAHSLQVTADIRMEDGSSVYSGTIALPYFVALQVPHSGNAPTEPLIVMDSVQSVRELAFDPGTPRWSGPEDLSAAVYLAWDNAGLHLQARVRDQDVNFEKGGAAIWANDCLQIGFLSASGVHTEVTLSGSPEGNAQVWCHISEPANHTGVWAIPAEVRTANGTITYTVTLPWERLGISAKKGELLRMALLVADNDNGKRLRVMEWGRGIDEAKNPDQFNWLLLE